MTCSYDLVICSIDTTPWWEYPGRKKTNITKKTSIGILTCVYPPTPADARGSAPGNNTFDPCFGLLPPPLPWCFPIRQLSFEQKEQQQQQQQQQQPAAAGLDGVIRQLSFEQKEQQQQQQQPAAAGLDGAFPSGNCFLDCASVEKYCFSRISDDTLGSFLARFWH